MVPRALVWKQEPPFSPGLWLRSSGKSLTFWDSLSSSIKWVVTQGQRPVTSTLGSQNLEALDVLHAVTWCPVPSLLTSPGQKAGSQRGQWCQL